MMRASGINVRMDQLESLVGAVNSGQLGLPEFQREFDWSETDVVALLVTVLSGWPAGSLMLMDGRSELAVNVRGLEGGPAVKSTPKYVILDGQQRLTALYQAFLGIGDAVFAVRWDIALESDLGLDDAIVVFKRRQWEKKLSTPREQLDNALLPVKELLTATDYFEWRDRVLDVCDQQEASEVKEQLGRLYRDRLAVVHSYEFPTVLIERDVEPEAIARIFERVNRHGMQLNTFDLMVAKVFEPGWNLRDQWNRARRDSRHLDRYLGDDGMPVLQSIALKYQYDLRQSAVLRLNRNLVHDSWDTAISGMDRAIGFITEECGVVRREFLPYPNMLVPIAALAMDGGIVDEYETLKRWFWQSVFSRRFSVAANTRLVNSYRALEKAVILDELADGVRVDRESLEQATRKSDKALWAGAICVWNMLLQRKGLLCATAEPGGVEHGMGDMEPVSLFGTDEGPQERSVPKLHLRALGMVLLPKSQTKHFRALPSSDFAKKARDEGLTEFIEAQGMPDLADIEGMQWGWQGILKFRAQKLASIVDEETSGGFQLIEGGEF